MDKLTPHQGKDRQYGYFECKSCKREWESGYTWANTGQKCKKCNVMIYPFKQQPLKGATDDSNVPHQEHLCGKCIQLGYSCKNFSG